MAGEEVRMTWNTEIPPLVAALESGQAGAPRSFAHSGGSWKRMHLPSKSTADLVDWLVNSGRATAGAASAMITL